MPADQPFLINVRASLTGFTQNIVANTSSASVTLQASTVGFFTAILVTNFGSNQSYIRIDTEASPTATTSDCCIPGNTVRLFASPAPNGTVGIAVIATATGNTVYFTPGQGGVE